MFVNFGWMLLSLIRGSATHVYLKNMNARKREFNAAAATPVRGWHTFPRPRTGYIGATPVRAWVAR